MIPGLLRTTQYLDHPARRALKNRDTAKFERRQNEHTGEEYYKRLSTGCIILAENKERRTDELTGVTYYRDTSNNRTFITAESRHEIFNFFANSPNQIKDAIRHQAKLQGVMKDFGSFTAFFTEGGGTSNGLPQPAGVGLQCNTTGELIGFIPLHLDLKNIIELFKNSYLEQNKVEIPADVLDEVKSFIENLRAKHGF